MVKSWCQQQHAIVTTEKLLAVNRHANFDEAIKKETAVQWNLAD